MQARLFAEAGILSETVSPLILSDRLLTLAKQADLAGLVTTASRLVILAHTVLDEFAAPPAYQLPPNFKTASSRAAIAA